MRKTKEFFEGIIKNKTGEYTQMYASRFNYNKMIDDIKALGLPEEKTMEVLNIIKKYHK